MQKVKGTRTNLDIGRDETPDRWKGMDWTRLAPVRSFASMPATPCSRRRAPREALREGGVAMRRGVNAQFALFASTSSACAQV
jgi:hypothetical protein